MACLAAYWRRSMPGSTTWRPAGWAVLRLNCLKVAERRMTQCSKCGHQNRPRAKFCARCGERLSAARPHTTPQRGATVKVCPRCQAPSELGARICGRCGYRFVSHTPAAVGRANRGTSGLAASWDLFCCGWAARPFCAVTRTPFRCPQRSPTTR